MDADSAATVVHDEVYSAGPMTSTRYGLPIRGRTRLHGSAYRFRAVSREQVSLRGPTCAIRPGHMRLDPHPDASAAVNALARFARAKRRRGYRVRRLW